MIEEDGNIVGKISLRNFGSQILYFQVLDSRSGQIELYPKINNMINPKFK